MKGNKQKEQRSLLFSVEYKKKYIRTQHARIYLKAHSHGWLSIEKIFQMILFCFQFFKPGIRHKMEKAEEDIWYRLHLSCNVCTTNWLCSVCVGQSVYAYAMNIVSDWKAISRVLCACVPRVRSRNEKTSLLANLKKGGKTVIWSERTFIIIYRKKWKKTYLIVVVFVLLKKHSVWCLVSLMVDFFSEVSDRQNSIYMPTFIFNICIHCRRNTLKHTHQYTYVICSGCCIISSVIGISVRFTQFCIGFDLIKTSIQNAINHNDVHGTLLLHRPIFNLDSSFVLPFNWSASHKLLKVIVLWTVLMYTKCGLSFQPY